MTPKEVYNLPVKSTSFTLKELYGFYYNHIPEIECIDKIDSKNNSKISVRIHHEVICDQKRFYRLASVWFENTPFMIIQNAGRKGGDYTERWISDKEYYDNTIRYLLSITPEKENPYIIDPNHELGNVFYFYGHDVREEYNQGFWEF